MSKGWPLVKLGEVLKQRKEFIIIDDTQEYMRCRVQLHAKGIILRDRVIGSEIKTKQQQICKAGEFLVAEIDAKVGGFGIVPDQLEGAIVSSHYFLFSLDLNKINDKFLDYYAKTPSFKDQVNAKGSTNYAAIRPKDILGYTIPLPPLAEQQRIVAKIERLAGKIEEAKNLQTSVSTNNYLIWDAAAVKVFEQLSECFSHKKFSEVCEVVRGGSPRPAGSSIYYEGKIPFLKVADLTADDSVYLHTYKSTIKEAGLSKTRFVVKDTLMLTNSGATLGVPKICRFGTAFNDGIQAFLGLPSTISKEYLYFFLASKTNWFRNCAARGQGQPNLNTGMVKALSFPYPPLAKQLETVNYLQNMRSKVQIIHTTQDRATAELDALLPSILDKAFKGEL